MSIEQQSQTELAINSTTNPCQSLSGIFLAGTCWKDVRYGMLSISHLEYSHGCFDMESSGFLVAALRISQHEDYWHVNRSQAEDGILKNIVD